MCPSVSRPRGARLAVSPVCADCATEDLDYSECIGRLEGVIRTSPRRRRSLVISLAAFTNDRVVRRLRSMWLVSASAAMPRCWRPRCRRCEQHLISTALGAVHLGHPPRAESGSGWRLCSTSGWPADLQHMARGPHPTRSPSGDSGWVGRGRSSGERLRYASKSGSPTAASGSPG